MSDERVEIESVSMPAVGLYVNVDVNDLLGTMTRMEVFEFLGQLKDLFDGWPDKETPNE